jgi:hypothetical protein
MIPLYVPPLMRDAPRRLPLIAVSSVGALIALIFGGTYVYRTSGSLFGFGGESPAERVALKDSDLPTGMTRCTISEQSQGKGGDTQFDGASDAATAIYADDCDAPPSRRYAFSWVVEFDSETAALAAYRAFVGSQDCTVAHGCVDWGLGQNFNLNCGTAQGSNPGAASCLGTWQRNAFMVTFIGIMGSINESKKAVLDMDARAGPS